MQKMTKKLVMSLFSGLLLVLLVACSGQKQRHFQDIDQEAGLDTQVTYTYEKEKVTSLKTVSTALYSNINAADEEEAKAILSNIETFYKDIKGVKMSLDYKKDRVVLNMEVDYKTFEQKDGFTVPGFFTNQDDQKIITNLEKNVKAIKDMNFKEVKDGKFKTLK